MTHRTALLSSITAAIIMLSGCSGPDAEVRFTPEEMPLQTVRIPKSQYCAIPTRSIDTLFESPDDLDTVKFPGRVFATEGLPLENISGKIPDDVFTLLTDFVDAGTRGDNKAVASMLAKSESAGMLEVLRSRPDAIHEKFLETIEYKMLVFAVLDDCYFVVIRRLFDDGKGRRGVIGERFFIIAESDGLKIAERPDFRHETVTVLSRLAALPHSWIRKILTDAEKNSAE